MRDFSWELLEEPSKVGGLGKKEEERGRGARDIFLSSSLCAGIVGRLGLKFIRRSGEIPLLGLQGWNI